MALNEVGDALENQIEALENLQSGDIPDLDSFTSDNSIGESSLPEQGSNAFPPTPSEDSDFSESPFSSSTPFSDPEVSEVLAQTLDSLDQAIFENTNPYAEPQEGLTETPSSSGFGQGEQPGSEAQPGESYSEPSSDEFSGEPLPGTGQGNGGNGQGMAALSASDAMALALQSLQLASDAHAQTMAQQRTKIMMADARGNQMNSSDGDYQTSPVAEVGDLPNLEEMEGDDEWGKLPPKLAKDLMEAKREKVSENYRNQVQAYFQAMSNKARTTKK